MVNNFVIKNLDNVFIRLLKFENVILNEPYNNHSYDVQI